MKTLLDIASSINLRGGSISESLDKSSNLFNGRSESGKYSPSIRNSDDCQPGSNCDCTSSGDCYCTSQNCDDC
jgi:hypothetical protein